MITLYHGSPFEFDTPDPSLGRSFRDFGPGFYLSEAINDAQSIAVKTTWSGFLYTYEVDDEALFSHFNVLELYGFHEPWLRFVYGCRMFNDQQGYDVIIGQTAGGGVNGLFKKWRDAQAAFEDVAGEMSRTITDTRFGIQWCIANAGCLDFVYLSDIEEITR